MTKAQALTIETKKYAEACSLGNTRKAHIHRLVIERLTGKRLGR